MEHHHPHHSHSHSHSLAPLVSPASFHALPSPLPLDLLAAKHLSANNTTSTFKHSLTLNDVKDQPNPIDFCYSLGAHHLLEQFTRATLPTLEPTPGNARHIMLLWTHRLSALVALDLAHIALAEARTLDLVHHPLAPLHLQLAAARLPALANDPLRALDLLAKVAARLESDTTTTSTSTSSLTALLAAYRHMIAVAAWHLSDPRLVSHLISQLESKITISSITDKRARIQWWIDSALARMAVTQLVHAEHAVCSLEHELGSGAALVQCVRATLLSCRGQHAEAAAAWTSLWHQVAGTARRVRAYEAALAGSTPLAPLVPHLPTDFMPLSSATADSPPAPTSPATYAADHAWLSPLVVHTPHLLRAINNNRLVSQVYHALSPVSPESLLVDWMQAAKWGMFADPPLVGNLATWIEVSPNGSVAGEQVSEMDRKRDVLRTMTKASDAACVAALRMG
ncbi:hypothetical protein BCR44DRAFT_1460532 [Catenaria anguillulae PL171]|uniref:Uncharacterized protein n=1 Tax=Catenaria anguillulae PL171 TaxID=765915 RepID=A0A1Y2HNE2_9FUNG|nr:hypothetical protein BCR44DRAFT_1460532 [Catenaria anguillulae PL171]